MRNCLLVQRQHAVVYVTTDLGCVLAGLDAGTRGSAHRLASKRILKANTISRHSVQIGCRFEMLAVASAGVPALLVTENKYDVGFLHFVPISLNVTPQAAALGGRLQELDGLSLLCRDSRGLKLPSKRPVDLSSLHKGFDNIICAVKMQCCAEANCRHLNPLWPYLEQLELERGLNRRTDRNKLRSFMSDMHVHMVMRTENAFQVYMRCRKGSHFRGERGIWGMIRLRQTGLSFGHTVDGTVRQEDVRQIGPRDKLARELRQGGYRQCTRISS
jgi:hypothetical protein